MRIPCRYLPPLLLLLLAACHPASAPNREPETIAGWQIMTKGTDAKTKLCYAGEWPAKSSGTVVSRAGKPYLMVTRKPSGKLELSVSSGYPYAGGSKVELLVDDTPYAMLHKDAVAWAHNDRDDALLVKKLKRTTRAIEVRGVSRDGHTSDDTYLPNGFANVVARLEELCK